MLGECQQDEQRCQHSLQTSPLQHQDQRGIEDRGASAETKERCHLKQQELMPMRMFGAARQYQLLQRHVLLLQRGPDFLLCSGGDLRSCRRGMVKCRHEDTGDRMNGGLEFPILKSLDRLFAQIWQKARQCGQHCCFLCAK